MHKGTEANSTDGYCRMQEPRDAADSSDTIVERRLDTGEDRLGPQVVEIVAELEECDRSDLSALSDRIDHHVQLLFSDSMFPEPREAVTLLYEGYQIILHRGGKATFTKLPGRDN